MSEKRGNFTGKIGFVLAAAGSAVGLGNIWRFPYLAAKYGGGIFLLVYLLLTLTFGFALLCAEIAIGRKTGQSSINAFAALDKRFKFVGVLGAVIPLLILPYYSVIGGWVMKYFAVFVSGQMDAAANPQYFVDYIQSTNGNVAWEPIGWFFLFIGITALVVLFGVEKGVEKVSKWMMPLLIVLVLFVAVYTAFMPGAMNGVAYYLIPDFSKFSATTVIAAMGQLFYSMSIAMGIMITYGSYMKKDVNIESSVHHIEIFDTGIAFLAGLMIIPGVFATRGSMDGVNPGPGLMFATLPSVFQKMPGGAAVGGVFFLLVFLAAVTSSISLMETIVSVTKDKFGWNRKVCCAVIFVISLLLGVPSSLGFGPWAMVSVAGKSILDMFDILTNSIMMPIVALFTCIVIGYIVKPKTIIEEIEQGGQFKLKTLFTIIIKYVAPVCILLILIFSVMDAFKIGGFSF